MTTTEIKRYLKILLIFSGVFFCSCQPKIKVGVQSTQQADGGWGYQILKDTSVYINQPYIPAVSGHQTFKSEEDAMKAGRLVLKKIVKRQNPAITIHELDSLDIQYTK
ncbi:DUF4907 domain-containing protein [Mangrovibacterium diazotrophicum]|nr:DUF4907 domain-containing protein [Mangrovibacterium diazotrophicum]